ncbi:hypothetical protein HBH52_252550 [Parastagonospora nodorum]|nr:hypothetical protein HBH52_252550 [Parastagonospora nodorum]
MSQTNVREGYRITTLEVIKLIEDLISYYSAKVKIEDLSNTLTPTLSETAQRQSLSVVSNRSTALITNKFSVTSLTKPAILNNANIALVDAVHYSVIDALTITLIKDDDDLLGTVNSYIKLRRLRALLLPEQLLLPKKRGRYSKLILDRPPLKRCKTKAADSRYAKASRGRTKKDKDLEDSNTSSDLDSLLDSDDYCLDSSLDINSEDDLEDEEATTAKNLAREQKERLKALLNAKTRDSLSARVETAIEHCTLEEIFANAIEVQNARAEGDAIEYNAVNNNDKLYPTKGERTFYCACERSLSFNCDLSDPLALQFCFFSNFPPENISRLTKEEAIEMQINTTNAISKALAAANKDILEKESLNKSEASRRVIFNRFEMQAIASYPALATLKAAYIAAEDAAKAANTPPLLKEVCAKILIRSYKLIVQAVTWLGLREKFSDESVLVMQRDMT